MFILLTPVHVCVQVYLQSISCLVITPTTQSQQTRPSGITFWKDPVIISECWCILVLFQFSLSFFCHDTLDFLPSSFLSDQIGKVLFLTIFKDQKRGGLFVPFLTLGEDVSTVEQKRGEREGLCQPAARLQNAAGSEPWL